MSIANSSLAPPRFRGQKTPITFFRIEQLRRLCECEQVAAVCYRVNQRSIEFLLVQTHNGRWTFPKGSAEPGLTHAQTAALEAFEEAGVHGRMEEASFGRYFRRRKNGRRQKIAVSAHLCEVVRLERTLEPKRKPTWFSAEEAKQRLRKDRVPDYGAELARIVVRAVARIERLREISVGPDRPRLAVSKVGAVRNDTLLTVPFTLIEGARKSTGGGTKLQLVGKITQQSAYFRRS